ncbi:dehydrogenase, partial [Microbacterium sp. SUBG005]
MTRSEWDPENLPDLSGRSYLVTGATRGLGYFACEQLAAAGAHVLLTGRNPHSLSAAKAAVKRSIPDAAIETLLLDTSNMGSVRAAAATARARGRLDGLLLNAGVVHPPKQRETVGGHELVFATNVLGHFALAGELLKPL